jgi:nucleoid-associated protein YgaU
VESYDEESYTAKANDTFRAISQQFYHTDQYERALLLFNRNHPLANSTLQQGSAVLQAGQSIYIPPARILEQYYGAPVSNSAPSVPSALPPSRAVSRPDAAGSVRQASASVMSPGATVQPAPSSSSVPLYRVREGGEMLREIAHRTLDNGDRWADIYRLNPSFDPKEVIPAGSLLRLPRDARVDPRDRP